MRDSNNALHLNDYTREHLLNVVTVLQEFYSLPRSPFAPAGAVVGIHRAVLHALTVFNVSDGARDYIATMQRQGRSEKAPVEELIKWRIREIEAEQAWEGYPADWALRGLLVILRDEQLLPYRSGHSLFMKALEYFRGVPQQYQLRDHEEALLTPVGRNLTEIFLAYTRARRSEAA